MKLKLLTFLITATLILTYSKINPPTPSCIDIYPEGIYSNNWLNIEGSYYLHLERPYTLQQSQHKWLLRNKHNLIIGIYDCPLDRQAINRINERILLD